MKEYRDDDLHWKHSSWAFPAHPTGHVHTAMWLAAVQMAWGAQGFVLHGSTQEWSMQALLVGQSASLWHSPLLTAMDKLFCIFCFLSSFFLKITWSAGAVAISCCSFWAEALSPVVLRAACCNACAGISNQARIYTLSVFTGSWARTLRVRWAAKLKRSNWQRKVINEWFIMYHFPLDEH